MINGTLKIIPAKQTGNEAYPPIPNINFGLVLKIKISDFIIARNILKKEINFFLFKDELFIKITFSIIFLSINFLPLSSVVNIDIYPFLFR